MARVLLMIMALAMALAASFASAITSNEEEEQHLLTNALPFNDPLSASEAAGVSSSARGVGRLLTQYNPRASVRCDKNPRVCHASGSPGPDCCKKKCVNVRTDSNNCGWCGRRCGYGQTCCSGRCVNVMHDFKNCGACSNKCKAGGFCNYGLCSYA